MNLYPSTPDPGGPHAPPEWTMELGCEGEGEELYYYANLFRAGERVCRLAAMGKVRSEEEARRVLAVRARHWIAEYLARPHSGDTDLGTLQ
jgi:hypothetical protein